MVNFGFFKFRIKKDLKAYLPELLKSNKSVSEIVNKIKRKYKKNEIVEYFRTDEGNDFVHLSQSEELFLHGSLIMSFDDWLCTVINLMIFSKAHETYEKYFDEAWDKEVQVQFADNLYEDKTISVEQHLYLTEIINCITGIWQEKES